MNAGGNNGGGLGMFDGSNGGNPEDINGYKGYMDRMRAAVGIKNRGSSGEPFDRAASQAAQQARYGSPGGRGESTPPPVAFTPSRKEQRLKL